MVLNYYSKTIFKLKINCAQVENETFTRFNSKYDILKTFYGNAWRRSKVL